MGKKDITGKAFFSDKERFAELINLHLYHGEKILRPQKLIRKMKREELPMCKAFDDLMEEERRNGKREGMKKGLEKSVKRGKKKERLDIISRMKQEGMNEEQIIRVTKCTKKEYAAVGA